MTKEQDTGLADKTGQRLQLRLGAATARSAAGRRPHPAGLRPGPRRGQGATAVAGPAAGQSPPAPAVFAAEAG